MLDSIGVSAEVAVVCAGPGCDVQVTLPTYKPTHGHAAEPLNGGPYFDSDKFGRCLDAMHVFESGRLFRVIGAGDPAVVSVYRSHTVANYGYNGMLMSELAPAGDVVWVCAACLDAFETGQHPWAHVLREDEARSGIAAPCLTDYFIRWQDPRERAYMATQRAAIPE